MNCGDTIKCIERFVNHDLTPREMEGFLNHVAECHDCYEELETYYTVAVTLHFLEKNEEGNYNIPLRLKEHLDQERQRLRNRRILRWCVRILLALWLVGLVWFMVIVQMPELFAFLPMDI